MPFIMMFTCSAVVEYIQVNQRQLNPDYYLVVSSTFIVIQVSARSQQDLKYVEKPHRDFQLLNRAACVPKIYSPA